MTSNDEEGNTDVDDDKDDVGRQFAEQASSLVVATIRVDDAEAASQ